MALRPTNKAQPQEMFCVEDGWMIHRRPDRQAGAGHAGRLDMSGSNSRLFSRVMILAFVGVVFVATAAMMGGHDASLFADVSY
jgi:hypothetical protein